MGMQAAEGGLDLPGAGAVLALTKPSNPELAPRQSPDNETETETEKTKQAGGAGGPPGPVSDAWGLLGFPRALGPTGTPLGGEMLSAVAPLLPNSSHAATATAAASDSDSGSDSQPQTQTSTAMALQCFRVQRAWPVDQPGPLSH
jgi:hypothetical protein